MKYPFAPLTEAMGEVYRHNEATSRFGKGHEATWERITGNPCTLISELTGINLRTLVRWTKDGIPETQADRIAVALGLHVALIWPAWFPAEAGEKESQQCETVTQ